MLKCYEVHNLEVKYKYYVNLGYICLPCSEIVHTVLAIQLVEQD